MWSNLPVSAVPVFGFHLLNLVYIVCFRIIPPPPPPPPPPQAWVAWYGDTTVSLVDTAAMRPLSEGVKMRMKNKRTKPRKLPRPLLNAITEALEGIRERQEM